MDDLRFFHMTDATMDGIPIKVARAGYTGVKGNSLLKDGRIVGRATKYTTGFTCGKNIG